MRNLFSVLILILVVFMVSAFAGLSDEIGGNTLEEFVFDSSDSLMFSDVGVDNIKQLKSMIGNFGIVSERDISSFNSLAEIETGAIVTITYNRRNNIGIDVFGWVLEVSTTRYTKPGNHIS